MYSCHDFFSELCGGDSDSDLRYTDFDSNIFKSTQYLGSILGFKTN